MNLTQEDTLYAADEFIQYYTQFNSILEYQLKVKEDRVGDSTQTEQTGTCCHSVHLMMISFRSGICHRLKWSSPFLYLNKRDSVIKHSVRNWMWCHHTKHEKYSWS